MEMAGAPDVVDKLKSGYKAAGRTYKNHIDGVSLVGYILRTDPYEFADQTSNTYYDWFLYNAYFIYAAQTGATMFAATFKDFPPIQKPGSFTLDEAISKMADAGAGAS